jgi:Holliday junction resolvase RusA-like endonuclease
MSKIVISVFGDPASQGSHAIINGRIVQVNSAKHKKWRNAVCFAALDVLPADWKPLDEPVDVSITFYLPRPASIDASKRPFPTVSPDCDKLVRAVLDSLTDAGVYVDDSRVVRLTARKLYDDDRRPGALIRVKPLAKNK